MVFRAFEIVSESAASQARVGLPAENVAIVLSSCNIGLVRIHDSAVGEWCPEKWPSGCSPDSVLVVRALPSYLLSSFLEKQYKAHLV